MKTLTIYNELLREAAAHIKAHNANEAIESEQENASHTCTVYYIDCTILRIRPMNRKHDTEERQPHHQHHQQQECRANNLLCVQIVRRLLC